MLNTGVITNESITIVLIDFLTCRKLKSQILYVIATNGRNVLVSANLVK